MSNINKQIKNLMDVMFYMSATENLTWKQRGLKRLCLSFICILNGVY